jgi:hypothetical protein
MGKSVVTPEKTVEGNMKKENKIKSVPLLDRIIPVEPQNGANKKRASKTDHPIMGVHSVLQALCYYP